MLFKKLFTVTINVRNPIGFCAGKEHQAMVHLKSVYERRCFMGSYIVSIDKVVKTGACRIVNTNVSAEATVDVQFLATVGVLARWDIVPGVKIIGTDLLVGGETVPDPAVRHEDTRDIGVTMVLAASPETRQIRAGQVVCARVLDVVHKPLKSSVTACGKLLTCERAGPIYKVHGKLTRAAATEMMSIVVAIDAELARRKSAFARTNGDFMLFEGLLYTYARTTKPEIQKIVSKVAATWEGPKHLPVREKGDVVNLLDIVRAAAAGEPQPFDGVWSRPLTLYRSSPLVHRGGGSAPSSDLRSKHNPEALRSEQKTDHKEEERQEIIEETPPVVAHVFLKSILEFLSAVRCMTEIYNTEKIKKDHQNIWAVMKAAQIPQI